MAVTYEFPERLQCKIGYRASLSATDRATFSGCLVLDATGRPISMDVRRPETIGAALRDTAAAVEARGYRQDGNRGDVARVGRPAHA
jgi:hypothetical protein